MQYYTQLSVHLHNEFFYSSIMAGTRLLWPQIHSETRLWLTPRAFIADSDEFQPRKLHASFVDPDYIGVVGGDGNLNILTDCCVREIASDKSTDKSIGWECDDCTEAFPKGIAGHQIVKFNGKHILTGGYDKSYDSLSTVYLSDDGKSWKSVRPLKKSWTGENNGFTPRYGHGSVVLDDQVILVMGGVYKSKSTLKILNDVWKSTDEGRTWDKIYPSDETTGGNSQWSPRSNFAIAKFPHNGKDIVVILGGDIDESYPTKTDIWLSDDQGKSWTEITPSWKEFKENSVGLRAGYVPALSEPDKNKYRIMVVGGRSDATTDSFMQIGTFTYDGNDAGWTVEWKDCTEAPWWDAKDSWHPRRWDHALSVSKDNKVYVTAGDLGGVRNDQLWEWQCDGTDPKRCFENVCDVKNWSRLYPAANDKLYMF